MRVQWLWFLGGAGVMGAILCGAFVLAATRANGFSARASPTLPEAALAHLARRIAMPGEAKNRTNPMPDSDETLAEGREHWADHCAVCHANNGSGHTEMGGHLYPPAPDMRSGRTQALTDGELFYIIENGIRLTGMPAWGNGTQGDADDSWKLVRFIRHLPQLTAAEEREMEKFNPKSPDELREEQQEQDFLKGESTE
jgi:mono/diheme cytochrome c family protein